MDIKDYIGTWPAMLINSAQLPPWEITGGLSKQLLSVMKSLNNDYRIEKDIAIHRSATVEENVVLKGPVIIGPSCFIGAHAYLRNGVFLGGDVSIGPGCELKSSIVLERSALAHFNFIGDSIIGIKVNMEAGSVIANHYNEREHKLIQVLHHELISRNRRI